MRCMAFRHCVTIEMLGVLNCYYHSIFVCIKLRLYSHPVVSRNYYSIFLCIKLRLSNYISKSPFDISRSPTARVTVQGHFKNNKSTILKTLMCSSAIGTLISLKG